MEELVKTAIGMYPGYVSETLLLKMYQKTDDPISADAAFDVAKMRKQVIEAWLRLLTEDERFVVQKHLIEKLEWTRVCDEFEKRWGFPRTERTLGTYQASAIKKIAEFAMNHKELTERLFLEECAPTA